MVRVLRRVIADRRTELLAVRVAERIDALLGGDAEDLDAKLRQAVKEAYQSREYDCPSHKRPLRLDRSSIGGLVEVYYCPTRGCQYVQEQAR